MKRLLIGLISWMLLCSFPLAYATTPLADAANNVLVPVNFLSEAMLKVSIILGVAFMAGALMQYTMHRQSPTAVPISRPIWLFMIGLILIGIPIAGKYAYLFNEAARPKYLNSTGTA